MASTVMPASPPLQDRAPVVDGGMTRQQVAQHFGVTSEAIRQTELKALRKLREHLEVLGVTDGAFARPSGEESAPSEAVRKTSDSSRARSRGRGRPGSAELGAMEREAEAWADQVLALRLNGVPLPLAWSAASGCRLP